MNSLQLISRTQFTHALTHVSQVPAGHVWVEGDNAANSNDSNHFGAVPTGLVVARVRAKLWPPREIGLVRREEPDAKRVLKTAGVYTRS